MHGAPAGVMHGAAADVPTSPHVPAAAEMPTTSPHVSTATAVTSAAMSSSAVPPTTAAAGQDEIVLSEQHTNAQRDHAAESSPAHNAPPY